ncbi:hypothetical protein KDX30_19725 [Pseudomonas sp. CDFA 553]|uniref:DUF4376 domain-containing protein n=1 Tax=Pseudomonas quasicaspiana TaxID=2829821 RepID=UPI001E624AD3|nr:hypothetical protein [Pseudomonas quasicaspiana]MCD5990122.1 hypothetical protein [Pseudomonas quasicaspiana]
MKRFYSPSTQNTYLVGINSQAMPADAVEISEARYLEVIANPPLGKTRSHDANGLPFLSDTPQPTLEELAAAAHSRQVETINLACESAITAGFDSAALGAMHYYTSQLDDQMNLTGAVLSGTEMLYACRDEQGIKAFRLHTADQLRQVRDDFTQYTLQLLQRAFELKQRIDQALAAGDLDAINAVSWESEQ